ncbi:glycerophosphodiester phosphodiesterase [Rhodovibrionaceae bacterium A322]
MTQPHHSDPSSRAGQASNAALSMRSRRRLSWPVRLSALGLVLSLLLALVLFGPELDGKKSLGLLPQAEAAGSLPDFDAQGHRGARGLLPENTLPAFEEALAIGVTTLELDVGLSLDNQVIISHDPTLSADITRDDQGRWLEKPTAALRDLTLAELKSYDVGRSKAGSRTQQRFPDQQPRDGTALPTLSDLFALAEPRSGGKIRYNIETKIRPGHPTSPDTDALVRAILTAVQDAAVTERVSLQSFDWQSLMLMKNLAPEIPRVHLTAQQRWLDNVQAGQDGASPWLGGFDYDDHGSVPALVAAAGGQVWSPYWKDLSDADLKEAQALGLKVVVWTVNSPEDMARLIDQGVDGIISDYPDRLRAVMADKGLALPPAYPKP